ncbi:unnamed protein product [Paramecium sonneborni]|uniref:WD domain, G-beta repeat protein n=1 Tax=Paramecium sonneborni TaxID=65129 RepID=A0A8S1QCH5_9CILI|nr:unnamed protein product [Paramecium sonneborni]
MSIRCTQADHQNQQIIGICIESNCQYQRPYCHYCLPNHSLHLNQLIPLENLNEWIQRRMAIINEVQKNAQECKSILDSLINIFIPYLNINVEQLGISQIDNIIKGFCKIEVCEQQLFNQLKQSLQQVQQIIDEILKKTKSQTNYKQKVDIQVQQTQNMKPLIQEQTNQISIFKQNLKPFIFDLIEQNTIKQDQLCRAIAINKDCSILVAGCDNQIKVFEFKQGMLKQLQLLGEHKDCVNTLNFMNRSNHFLSGSEDNLIIIWARNQNNSWICQQKLNGHTNSIFCLVLNNNDDIIISGSRDDKIKFWIKQNEWQCSQTITDHTNSVYGLSLNEQQNRVISCGEDKLILVIEQSQQNKKWILIQKIQVEIEGVRLCFIDNNIFTFQPWQQVYMIVYEMNNTNKLYIKTKNIQLKDGSDYTFFPQQYIKQKCILVNKNGSNVNLIRKKQNGEFIIEQSILFETQYIYGCMTDDGQYLITWDSKSEEFKIRKYIET